MYYIHISFSSCSKQFILFNTFTYSTIENLKELDIVDNFVSSGLIAVYSEKIPFRFTKIPTERPHPIRTPYVFLVT